LPSDGSVAPVAYLDNMGAGMPRSWESSVSEKNLLAALRSWAALNLSA